MTREATERGLAQRTAHAMRAAALRQARERFDPDAEPAEAYGCVDWFLYDVRSCGQVEATARGASPAH